MQQIVINDARQVELFKAHDRGEVCDNMGNPIGCFVSYHEQDSKLYQWARTQMSDEELQHRKNERGEGRATSEVIRRLEAR